MAAYRRVYDSHHLQADCSGTLRSVIEYGLPLPLHPMHILTGKTVAGDFATHAGTLVEVVDGNAERSLRTRTTHTRMIAVVYVARSSRFTDQVNRPPVYPHLHPVNKRYLFYDFYRRCYACAVLAMGLCPCVCLSVSVWTMKATRSRHG